MRILGRYLSRVLGRDMTIGFSEITIPHVWILEQGVWDVRGIWTEDGLWNIPT